MSKITQQRLHELFNYDAETGKFIRKISKKGQLVGFESKCKESLGYIRIHIDGVAYRAHRLAWLFEYGEFPKNEIDHIDGNPSNNRIDNLRLSNSTQNKCNTRLRKDNTSGAKGIHWYTAYQKWQVKLTYNKKTVNLGYFKDFFEACCVIASERNKVHKEFANHGS